MPDTVSEKVSAYLRHPETATDLLQIGKTVLAATGAWWLSVVVLHSQMPFLAPWTALLTVHATVHRSLVRGAQTTVASAIGVGMSFVIGNWLGVSLWTFALALLVGLLASRVPWIRQEGIAVATTAIFVLGSGFDEQQPFLVERIVELALGVAVGVAVNVIVIPPMRDHQAAEYVRSINHRIGEVMTNMGEEFADSWDTDRADAWYTETESMSSELSSAWQSVRLANESRMVNPRPHIPYLRQTLQEMRSSGTAPKASSTASYEHILQRLDEGVSHLRHLTRTLHASSHAEGAWNEEFRRSWAGIMRDAGRAIAEADEEADLDPIFQRLDELSAMLADSTSLPEHSWPLYGALITSVRHIVTMIDEVSAERDAREAEKSAEKNAEKKASKSSAKSAAQS